MGRRSTVSFSEEPINYVLNPLRGFAIDSYRLLVKCTKPDAKGSNHEKYDLITFSFFPTHID